MILDARQTLGRTTLDLELRYSDGFCTHGFGLRFEMRYHDGLMTALRMNVICNHPPIRGRHYIIVFSHFVTVDFKRSWELDDPRSFASRRPFHH